MRFSVGLPQVLGGSDPSLLVEFAARAEDLGFSGLWTIDNAAGGPTATRPVLDAIHALTYVAAATRRIKLGTAVVVLPRRNPALLAKELATLDQLSKGRLIVGVGRGRDDESVAALGFPTDRPFGRESESVSVLRALWRTPSSAHDGKIWSFGAVDVQPKPWQPGGPPIWFGAAGPKTLDRVAQIADGWIGAGASTFEDFANQSALLESALLAHDRDVAAFPRAKRVYIGVGDDPDRARRDLAESLDGLYGAPGLAARTGVCGTVGECAERLQELAELGAGEAILTPVHDHLEQLELLARVADRVNTEPVTS